MTHPRLSLALQGADALPAIGDVLVIGPRAGTDLSGLPQDRLVIVQGVFPDHAFFANRGYRVVPTLAELGADFAAAILFLPRARAQARAQVAELSARVQPGGRVWIDGQKTDGVDTMIRDIRVRTAISAPVAKAHGKIFSFAAEAVFSDWSAEHSVPAPGFVAVPGVFSSERPDRGSELLAGMLPEGLKGRVAELGAGWGYLAAAILTRKGVTHLDLVEADHAALDCARQNISDPRAAFHWADAVVFRPEVRPGTVVMNPPFHTGRAAEPSLGTGFIRAAAGMLIPSGALYMVANRHLPYEAALTARFRSVEEIGGDNAFKILHAARPLAEARAPSRPRR